MYATVNTHTQKLRWCGFAHPTSVGGSGGNPEEKAITGLLRMLAMLPITNRVREERSRKQLPFQLGATPALEFDMPAVPCRYRQVS